MRGGTVSIRKRRCCAHIDHVQCICVYENVGSNRGNVNYSINRLRTIKLYYINLTTVSRTRIVHDTYIIIYYAI